MHLANKVVILTGASQGIGKAAAAKFIEAGCRVVLVARSEDRLAQIAEMLGQSHTLIFPADVGQPETGAQIVQETIKHFGQVDILVNNAAIGVYGPSATVSLSNIYAVMQVNFFGPLHLIQACVPSMQAQGSGLIINVSSITGRRSVPFTGAYCASKAALEHLADSLRLELKPYNIRVSTLYPGVTQTNFVSNALGAPQKRSGRISGISAEKVAAKLIQTARKEPRDAYVTLFDRAFVTGSRLFPHMFDHLLRYYFKMQNKL